MTYQWWIPLLGGIISGAYFALGLAYFETFSPENGDWAPVYLPAFLIMGLVGGGLTYLWYGGIAHKFTLAGRIIGMLMSFVLTSLVMGIYGSFYQLSTPLDDLLGAVFVDMGLLSLLPLVALLLWLQGSPVSPGSPTAPVPETAPPPLEPMLRLNAGQGSSAFAVARDAVILVEAADNYCKIHYLAAEERQMKMVRTRIRDVEAALGTADHFFRCHRSYLVNGKMVQSISGTSQAQKLEMMHGVDAVPVSRSFDTGPLQSFLAAREPGA